MEKNNKLFIGGLNYSTTEKILLDTLQQFGKVISLRIVADKETGKSKGYGFATFDTYESVQKAIAALDNQVLDGRRIWVKESIEKNRE